jgi:hypothetical protein
LLDGIRSRFLRHLFSPNNQDWGPDLFIGSSAQGVTATAQRMRHSLSRIH